MIGDFIDDYAVTASSVRLVFPISVSVAEADSSV